MYVGHVAFVFFFWPGLNPGPYIYYELSISTELSSQGHVTLYLPPHTIYI